MTKSSARASGFCPTKWDSAEQKEKFMKHFLRFVEKDFPESLFFDWFYKRLSNTFGHIAHYNRAGFYGEFFTSTEGKLDFLHLTLQHPCYGDPAFTYSDVERAIQDVIRERGFTETYKKKLAGETEAGERAELARLKAKYGA